MMELPTELGREPLVDAVFEVRMGGDPHLADLLPGILFGQLDPKPTIQRLPAAEIPQPIRAGDPNMAFAPVIRLDWREFTISFGDRNLVVGCKLPYPKWPRFKEVILDIMSKIAAVGITGPVDRYSIKYVNLIQAPTIVEQIAKINLDLRVGEVVAKTDHLSVQVHSQENETLHILSVVTGAQVVMANGQIIIGAIVDVDFIRTVNFATLNVFSESLKSTVELLRIANKIKFFSCLTNETLEEMEPKYDTTHSN